MKIKNLQVYGHDKASGAPLPKFFNINHIPRFITSIIKGEKFIKNGNIYREIKEDINMKLRYTYMISGNLYDYVSSRSKNKVISNGSFRYRVVTSHKIINIQELEKEIKEYYKARNAIIMGFELISIRRRFS